MEESNTNQELSKEEFYKLLNNLPETTHFEKEAERGKEGKKPKKNDLKGNEKQSKEKGKEGEKDDQQCKQQEDSNLSKTDSGNDVLDAPPSNTNELVSSDAAIDSKSGQEDKSSTSGTSKVPMSPTHICNDEERNEEQPMDITEDWDQKCENGDQKQGDYLKKNGGIDREVVSPEIQNRGEEGPSLFSRVVIGAKSMFGFPSNQVRDKGCC